MMEEMRKRKKYLYLILSVLCTAVIFMLSAQDATTSDALSKQVTNTVNKSTGGGLSNEMMRSMAHFALFWLLGVFVSLYLRERNVSNTHLLSPLIICVLYAVTDELHQEFFVTGREFELIDLAKDWGGSLLGCVIVLHKAICEDKK